MADTDTPSSDAEAAPPRGSSRKKTLWLCIGVCLLAAMMLTGYVALQSTPSPPPPLPDPNGYDDLIAAAMLIQGTPPADLLEGEVAVEALRAFVEPNRAALELASAGLEMECGTPLTFSQNIRPQVNRVSALRNLGRLFIAEAQLAAATGETTLARNAYLDAIQLGHASSRGGLLLDKLTGIGVESMGITGLKLLLSELTAVECKNLIVQLDDVRKHREPLDAILNNEAYWRHRTIPIYQRAVLGISGAGRDWLNPAIQQAIEADKRSQARLRLMITGLALQAYYDEKQSFPDDLADLQAGYIPDELRDPFSGEEFRHQQTEGWFRIYSVGPDKQDDAGRPLDPYTAKGDMVIDVYKTDSSSSRP